MRFRILTACFLFLLLVSFTDCKKSQCQRKPLANDTCKSDPGTQSLTIHYPWNSSADDVAGLNGAATLVNVSYAKDRFGNPGKALEFNGKDAYATIHNGFETNQRSFSFWFKANSYPSGAWPVEDFGYIMVLDNPNLKYGFITAYVGTVSGKRILDIGFGDSKTAEIRLDMDQMYSESGWYHLAYTQDKMAIKIYLNGKLQLDKVIPQFWGAVEGKETLNLGTTRNINGRFFDGYIDDLRFYNRPLTACEVNWLYTQKY